MITPAQRKLLQEMADAEDRKDWSDAEVVCEGIQCWIGTRRVSCRTINALLLWLAVHETNENGVRHYTLNQTGREGLKDESVIDRIKAGLRKGGAYDAKGHPLILDTPT